MNSFIRDGVCSRKRRNGGLSHKRQVPKKTRTYTRIMILSSDDDDDTNDTAVVADTSAVVDRPENETVGITPVSNKGDQDPSNEQTEQTNVDSSNNVDIEDLSSCVKDHKVDKIKGKHISYECWTNATNRNEDLENHLKGRDLEKEKIFELCYRNANFNVDKCISMMEQIGKKSYVCLDKIDEKRTKLIRSPCKEVTKITKPKMKRSHKLNCRIDKKIIKLFGKEYFESDKILMINELNNLKLKPNNNYFSSRITNFTDDNGSLSDISLNDISLGKIGEVFSILPTNDSVEKDVSPVVEVHENSTESHLLSEQTNLLLNNFEKFTSENISDVNSLQPSKDSTEKNENPAGPAVEINENSNMKTSESHLFREQTSSYANEVYIEDLQDSKKLTPRNDKIEVINPPHYSNLIVNDQDGHVEKSDTDKKEYENSYDNETLKIKICAIINMNDEIFNDSNVNNLALYLMTDDHLNKVDQLWATNISVLTADVLTKLIKQFDRTKYNMVYLSSCLVCVFRVIEESFPSWPNEIKKKLTLFISAIRKFVKHLDNAMWKKWFSSNWFSDWFVFLANVFIPNKNILTVDDKSLVNNAMKYLKQIKHDTYRFKNKKLSELYYGVIKFVDSHSTDTKKVNNTDTEETIENHETENDINILEKDNLIRTSEPKIAKLTLKKVHSAEAKNQIIYEKVLENTNTIHKLTKNKKRNHEKKQCLNEEIQQPFKKPLMTENQSNKHKLEENNEHTTQKKRLNYNLCNAEGNNRKTVIENNVNVLDKSLTTDHLQLKENCSTGSKNQIECENVSSVPENVVKIKVPSQFSISNTFKNPTFGINSELLPELLLKDNNDNTTENNCDESNSLKHMDAIVDCIMNTNNMINSGKNNPKIIQTEGIFLPSKRKKRSYLKKKSLSPPEAYYQVGNNPQKFGLTCDPVVSKNLSPYYKNISASNLNSLHRSIIPTNISSTQDSNNANTQPSTPMNTYPYSAINSWPSTAINTQSSTAINTQSSTVINTQSSIAVTTQSSIAVITQSSTAVTTQSSIAVTTQSSIAVTTQSSIAVTTQSSTAINTQSSMSETTQSCCSTTNTRPFSSMNTQPYSSMNFQPYSTMNMQHYNATNTRSSSAPNAQSNSATNTRPSSTTNTTQPSSNTNTQPYNSMNFQHYSSMNNQLYGTNGTTNNQPYSAPNTQLHNASTTELYRRLTNNMPYNNTMNFNIMQYNYNTQLPPNNQTNSNQLSSNYCNVHCNSSHNSFACDNSNNSSLNFNRNQNDSSFVNPLPGYSNLTVHPISQQSLNSALSNATSSSSSVMNTTTLDQNVYNYGYNYNPNQMSTGSYHPHAKTAQEKSGLPADYNDKVSPGLPDGQIQNTPNQANSVTMYAQN